ncbi:MAG: SusC/RagA family TonB-linked outer membrane protein [Bacteroidota bacterium]|nr:SusC/RagA family TonB-linked outer membrane protein [Bacteroidota bacterium]
MKNTSSLKWQRIIAILAFIFLINLANNVFAQNPKNLQIEFSKTTLSQVFTDISKAAGVSFSYDSGEIDLAQTITVKKGNYTLQQLVSNVCAQANLSYQINNNVISVKSKKVAFSNSRISGTIVDGSGNPVTDATIQNRQMKTSVLSDQAGNFSIKASPKDELQVSHIGFDAQNVRVQNLNDLKLILSGNSQRLSEVVVTSLGIKREKRALSYAVGEVKGEDINKAREPDVINSLAGRVPGLIISNTAGGPMGSAKVLIRGNTDITGDNQPLYVVDGVPMDNSNYGMTGSDKYAAGSDLGDAISGINPDDVETISVLKGPAASALYGSRAGHGVILITTKKGSNRKNLGVEFNSSSTIESLLTRFKNFQYQYGQGTGGTIPKDMATARATLFSDFGARLDPNLIIPSFNGGNANYGLVKNNIENFFQTGSSFSNNVAISGGTDKSLFRFSYNNLHYNDIVPKTYMDRNTFTLRGSTKIGSTLNVDVRASYMNELVNNRPALADDPANIGFNFVGLANNINQQVFANGYQDAFGHYVEWGGGQYHLDPYWVINRMSNKTTKDRIMGGITLNYDPLSWLSVQGRVNTDFTFLDYQKFSPPTTPGSESGVLEGRNSKYSTTNADVLFTVKKQITRNFYASASVGGSILYINSPSTYKRGEDMLLTDAITFNSFKKLSIQESAYEKQINSFYGTISTAFKNYLYVDATLRRDASSTLPIKNNTYWYPSLGASFVVTDALHIQSKILSFAKVRASAAQVGNDTDPYQLLLTYGLEPFQPSGASIGGVTNTIIPNPELKPTRTKSFEAGTDMRFINNRIGLEFTYYTSESRDQINYIDVPSSTGYAKKILNAGTVTNKGIEILLSGKVIESKNISWNVSFNAAQNKNVVKSLASGVSYLTLSDARWLGLSVIAKPGLPYGSIIGYDYQRTADGKVILDPATLFPMVTQDRTVLGKGTWDWTGGINNSFRFKSFTLNAIIDIKQGANLFSMTNLFAVIRGQQDITLAGRKEWIQSEEERQAAGKTLADWTSSGMIKGYVPQGVVQTGVDPNGKPVYAKNTTPVDPNIYWASYYGDDKGVATPFIYDASYIKMREITLSYRLPNSITRKISAQDISVAFVSRNPFIIQKKVPNVDPDSNYNNGNGQGLEYGSLPGRRSWGVNLNIKF